MVPWIIIGHSLDDSELEELLNKHERELSEIQQKAKQTKEQIKQYIT